MRRPNGHRNDRKRHGSLRLQWLLMAVLLLTYSAVPGQIQQPDRPIIDTTRKRRPAQRQTSSDRG
jgi:hypothetical protein